MKIITYIVKGKVKNVSVNDLMKLKIQLTETWESICQKCGKCCFEKCNKNGVSLINYSRPCEHLRFIARKAQCNVYSDRFTKSEKCLTIPLALQSKGLPSSCPYVKSVIGYKAPVDDGRWYKRARIKIAARSRYDEDYVPYASTPTASAAGQPAEGPERATGAPTREDLDKPKEWRRRMQQLREHRRQQSLVSQGRVGCADPRQKNSELSKKPSGHALGG